MNTFGETFRLLRKNRGISLKKAAEGIISYSTLAAFERNEHIINLQSLVEILFKMNITLQEFLSNINIGEPQYHSWLVDINNFSISRDLDSLNKELIRVKNNKEIFFELNYIMLKSIISQEFKSNTLSTDEINYVSEFLWKTEIIGHYELTVFGNTLYHLPTRSILIFSEEILEKINLLNRKNINSRDYLRTISNVVAELINRELYSDALMLTNKTKSEILDSYFFEKFIFQFYVDVIIYRLKFEDSIKQDVRRRINFLSEINAVAYHAYFKKKFEYFFNETFN